MTPHDRRMPFASVPSYQDKPGTTSTIAFSLAEQTVFCSMDSVRRYSRYRHPELKCDKNLYVDYGDIIPLNWTSWPKGAEGFLMSSLRPSSIARENQPWKQDKRGGRMGLGISAGCTPENREDLRCG